MPKQVRIEEEKLANNIDFRVLIVEDQSSDIQGPYLLTHHLGFAVDLAFDGLQAIVELKRASYDLVIMDWNMPYMSGSEVLKQIEEIGFQSHISRPIKIVLYTGADLTIDVFDNSENFQIIEIWRKPMMITDISKRLKEISSSLGRAV